ncbi:MAG: methyltransferase domain-containing protein [Sulfurimonas sp.]|uniref:methyltransferase domain-containing protein n=1 Tax=Sulfurimonas sp. TaxID=2022749 RepID=UPI0025E95AF6|nr:methyltransferase domain-containing protein [Sulfurimonas sp.]MCK9492055.1 methyltransferase domain-containing protein [Sulfurimonas sp.]
MKISSEFSKNALHYGSYNIIQKRVIERLFNKLDYEPRKILDLGCGSGAVCSKIDWDYDSFTGVDFARGMLELHPKSENIHCIYGDFNDASLFRKTLEKKYEHIFSASALQWAEDLERIFYEIKKLDARFSLAIFSSNTFKTLNKTANLTPLLRSAKEIESLQKKHLDAEMEVIQYKLEFESSRDMFRYIKKSGVSGSRKVLSYKETKKLMRDYPLNYLEFEVVFLYT